MTHAILFLFALLAYCLPVQAANYFTADLRARQATYKNAETKESLVAYLTQGLSSDQEKARAIAAWIAYQMEKNGYRDRQLIRYSNLGQAAPALLPNDPFVTRIGTPREFADLFTELATLAGLKAATIPGYAGKNISAPRSQDPTGVLVKTLLQTTAVSNYTLQRYEAAWNAVYTDEEWHLIDTYWMISGTVIGARGISTDLQMKTFLKQREKRPPTVASLRRGKTIDDDYFYAKPRFMIKTHFPNDSFWQFITPPRTWATFVS